MSGILYLVSTPIGNYEDITLRALSILKSVDVIVCEELREGRRLLSRYGIKADEAETLNEHNEEAITPVILEYLKAGKNVALISDAGTPVFSDPGRILVKKAIELDLCIIPVPGASSLVTALTVCGFPVDRFLFYGFPSQKSEKRIAELKQLKEEKHTILFMDAPYRLKPLLKDLAEIFGDQRRAAVAFNMTMPDERVYRGTARELYQKFEQDNIKGEFVVIVEGSRSGVK